MRRQRGFRLDPECILPVAMKTNSSTKTIGIDLGDRKHAICVLGAAGKILSELIIVNSRESMARLSKKHPGALVVMEVGKHSPWISRFFTDLGHRVLVANPRKVSAIHQNIRKSDRKDAVLLAKLARADESLLSPIEHGPEQAQHDLLQIKLRDNLVRQRVNVISSVAFTLKSLGIRLRLPNTNCFAWHARRELAAEHPQILELVEPSLAVIETMTGQIKSLDRSIAELAATSYPETEYLTQITGIGTITSLLMLFTRLELRAEGDSFSLNVRLFQTPIIQRDIRGSAWHAIARPVVSQDTWNNRTLYRIEITDIDGDRRVILREWLAYLYGVECL